MVTPPGGWGLSRFMSQDGAWPSGKAPVFGTGIRRFESFPPQPLSPSGYVGRRSCWASIGR